MTEPPSPPGEDDSWFSRQFGPAETPVETVLLAVASVKNTSLEDLDPLHEVADPDAIDALFEHSSTTDSEVSLAFTYEGCDVVLRDERVFVRER